MSHNCHTAIAKFVCHAVFNASYGAPEEDFDLTRIVNPEGFYEGEHSTEEEWKVLEAQDNIVLVSYGGWTHIRWNADTEEETDITCLKRNKGVSGELWVKGNKKVWLVNESPYSNGGEWSTSILAGSRKEIEDDVSAEELIISDNDSSESKTETAHNLKAYLLFFEKKEYSEFLEIFNRVSMITYGMPEDKIDRVDAAKILIKVLDKYMEDLLNR